MGRTWGRAGCLPWGRRLAKHTQRVRPCDTPAARAVEARCGAETAAGLFSQGRALLGWVRRSVCSQGGRHGGASWRPEAGRRGECTRGFVQPRSAHGSGRPAAVEGAGPRGGAERVGGAGTREGVGASCASHAPVAFFLPGTVTAAAAPTRRAGWPRGGGRWFGAALNAVKSPARLRLGRSERGRRAAGGRGGRRWFGPWASGGERLRAGPGTGEGVRRRGFHSSWSELAGLEDLKRAGLREGLGEVVGGRRPGCQGPPARDTSPSKRTKRLRLSSQTASSCTPPKVRRTRSMRQR